MAPIIGTNNIIIKTCAVVLRLGVVEFSISVPGYIVPDKHKFISIS
jgi:hypothetical protein